MIVNPSPDGWQIIYQQAHALLAMQLLLPWPRPAALPPARWAGLLAATAQHDDEQAAWHGRGGHYGLTPAGAPANFTQKAFSLEQARGVLAAARFQGQWRSLLTSLHLSCLYEPLRDENRAATTLLDELQAQQKAWRRALKINQKDAAAAYALLQWADRLSLILCRHELPEMGRTLEVAPGPDGQPYTVRQPDPAGPVRLHPWPYGPLKELAVSVEASQLDRLSYADDAALAAALRAAPIRPLAWTLVPDHKPQTTNR